MKGIFHFLIVATALLLSAGAQPPDGPRNIRSSVVRITTTTVDPDYRIPWMSGRTGGGTGAGFVISGNRIMTNAHVVSNARFLVVDRENDPGRYVARVKFIAHDADLAILELADPSFFKTTQPLTFGGIPAIESTVSAYGYPIGGERLSVTRGIVSRVDFQTYSHSGADAHLAIQIDAAINPGNSGGPVLQDGKVVGVAFQGYSGNVAQNTGYMIPVPVVNRFLKDIEDGRYDRYVDLAISTFDLQNPAQRQALGLPDDSRGILVTHVYKQGTCDGILEQGDVLLEIDGHPIESDGFVEIDGERVEMPEIVERKFLNDTVKLLILRNGEKKEVTASLKPAWQFQMQTTAYDSAPRYVLFAGLLFQPLDRDLLTAWRFDDLRVRYLFDNFVTGALYVETPEIILLSNVLADPINTYVANFRGSVVEEINGRKIRTLQDVADAIKEEPEYHIIKFAGEGRPAIIEHARVADAEERIHKRYRVLSPMNLEPRK